MDVYGAHEDPDSDESCHRGHMERWPRSATGQTRLWIYGVPLCWEFRSVSCVITASQATNYREWGRPVHTSPEGIFFNYQNNFNKLNQMLYLIARIVQHTLSTG